MTRCTPVFSDLDEDMRGLMWGLSSWGYAFTRVAKCEIKKRRGRVTIRAHRVVMERILGRSLLASDIVDHINRDRLDNRRENLRLTDALGNAQNRKASSLNRCGGLRGVRPWRGKYMACVKLMGKMHYAGTNHLTPEAAHAAAEAKRRELGFLDGDAIPLRRLAAEAVIR